MDLGTTITVLVILLIGVIPFALMNRSNKKREREFLEALNKLAEENSSKISSHDIWSNSAIGMDEITNMLFFTIKAKGSQTVEQINIADIQKCKLINTSRNFSNNGVNSKIIDKLALVFTYFDKLQLAEKWSKMVNEKIVILGKRK